MMHQPHDVRVRWHRNIGPVGRCSTCGWRKTGAGVFEAAANHRKSMQDLNNATVRVVSLPQRTETPIWGDDAFTKK